MKILHITDSHGTVKSPDSRTDIYYITFLKKMYELKYVIKKEDIKLIIHTGDLFHSSRVSDKFAGQLAEIIKSYGIPMYVVPGNHDIDGYNIDTLDQTKLGLLYKTGVVKELDRDKGPIQLKSQKENLVINISGQEYYDDIDNGNQSDFSMDTSLSADFNVLCIHGYLCDKPQNPNIKYTLCKDVITDADVILSGHFHESFEYHDNDFSVYNPGSLMRVEQNAYNKKHIPQYGILEITNNNGIISHSYTMHKFKIAKPSDEIFDYSAKAQTKKTLITLENFKNSIANTNFNNDLNTSIKDIIKDVSNNLSVTPDIENASVTAYNEALNNSPDKLDVQQGFIQDISRKIITSVEIENFQSHEKTVVNFKDGLNAIIGESNSGKTSILRAIRWCLDNDPHGSDFITTGKNDCSVTVIFDDNTKITRSRTRTDSGSYDVTGKTIQPDGTITLWTQTYKGFSNNVPIEVSNIHQMPKINLTKDICTHLNMMSQLDGPFLVTESPQVKAAIIGRLTGTQIIDLAVKETNKKILSNSKEIKFFKDQKESKLIELNKFNLQGDIEVLNALNSIDNFVVYNGNQIIEECYKLENLEVAERNINECRFILERVKFEIECYQYCYAIYNHILELKKVIDICKDISDTEKEISLLKKTVKWSIIVTSIKPFVNDCSLKIKDFKYLTDTKALMLLKENDIKDNKEIINKCNDGIESNKSYSDGLNMILDYISQIRNDINKYSDMSNKLFEYDTTISSNNSIIDKENDEIDLLNEEVKSLLEEQSQLIKDNNICPCCGQKLTTNKQVNHIREYMKGKTYG